MHALSLIADALPEVEREPLPCATVRGVCCVTGEEDDCIPRRELLGKSFCDQHLLRAPESPLVGVRAWWAMKLRAERASSWVCDGKRFTRLSRQDVRIFVLGGVPAPRWAGYITTSYKKHGALRAPVNSRGRQVWLFEMLLVDCTDRARVAEWWGVMTQAQRDGISRRSMEEYHMPPGIVAKIGIAVWERFREWARDKRDSPLYSLLAYLLPSAEEMKAEAADAASPPGPRAAPPRGEACSAGAVGAPAGNAPHSGQIPDGGDRQCMLPFA